MQETQVQSSGEGNATHSSTLAWKIPWMEEPGGLQSVGSQRVGLDWLTSLSLFTRGKVKIFTMKSLSYTILNCSEDCYYCNLARLWDLWRGVVAEAVNASCGKCYIQESRFYSQAGISQNVFWDTDPILHY